MKQYTFSYTEEEYKELKEKMSGIGNFLPEHLLVYVWDNYRKISGSNENRPCSCGSAAKHWMKAVGVIRNYINEVENNNGTIG